MDSNPLLIPCTGFILGLVIMTQGDPSWHISLSVIFLLIIGSNLSWHWMVRSIPVLILSCLTGAAWVHIGAKEISLNKSQYEKLNHDTSRAEIQEVRVYDEKVRWMVECVLTGQRYWVFSPIDSICGSPGDTIYVPKAKLIHPPLNPHEFNFKKWASNQGMYHQVWIKEFPRLKPGPKDWRRSCFRWAQQLENNIELLFPLPETQGMLKGVLLGNKHNIHPQVKEIFSQAGTLHVMAVSGLHVGVIAGILSLLFSAWSIWWWKWPSVLLTLSGIWILVCITGASASAVRAGIMFSAFKLGWSFRRLGNGLNTLCFCVICMLIFDPYSILHTGFQFSVIAVASIMVFMPYFNFNINGILWKGIAALTFLSVSVQIGLAPLSMFYFHTFPTYFALTNIIAIPGVTVLVVLGSFTLVCSLIHLPSAFIIAPLVEGCATFLLNLISACNELPGHSVQHIWIEPYTLLLYYFTLILLLIVIQKKWYYWVFLALLMMTTIYVDHRCTRMNKSMINEVISYSGKYHGQVDAFVNGTVYQWSSDSSKMTAFRSFKTAQSLQVISMDDEELVHLRLGDQEVTVSSTAVVKNDTVFSLDHSKYSSAIQIKLGYEK